MLKVVEIVLHGWEVLNEPDAYASVTLPPKCSADNELLMLTL